jgi:ABC-type lipoprotein export system ATPase subunit
MGFIFQDFALLPGFSAFENAALPLKYDGHQKSYIKKRMEQLLRQFGIFDRAGSYPQEMSGGEQQRVAIARAMARSPRILLADEPTGNLDEENARFVFNTLRALTDNDGVTVIVVTHDRQLAMMADTRIELERIIKSGVS